MSLIVGFIRDTKQTEIVIETKKVFSGSKKQKLSQMKDEAATKVARSSIVYVFESESK